MAVGVQALCAAQHAGQCLHGHACDVHLGLLGGQRDAGRLGVEPQLQAPLVGGAVAVAHPTGPDAAGGPELADLLEEVVVAVEEEAQAGGEVVDVKASRRGRLHVCEAVGQGEGQLVGGRRAGLPDVVAGDRHRVPAGHLGGGEPNHVGDQAHRRAGREDVLLLGLVLLEDVVLEGACQATPLDATLFGHGHVHGQQDRRWSVDGHRRGDGPQVDAGEQVDHVLDRVDGHAGPADLAQRPFVVGIAAHEGRHVEGRRQARAAGAEQLVEAGVGVPGGPEACEHPHGPEA